MSPQALPRVANALYLDTNCYTQILEAIGPESYSRIQRRLSTESASVFLSPVNIMEFLQTQDERRREQLVFLAQSICDARLLPSNEEILVHHIAETTTSPDLSGFLLSDGFGDSSLASVWREVRADSTRTFVVEPQQLRRFDVYRQIHSVIHAHYRRGGTLETLNLPPLDAPSVDALVATLRAAATDRRQTPAPPASGLELQLQECILLALVLVLCAEMSPFPEAVGSFWGRIGANTTAARLEYSLANFPFLLRSGPLVGIGAVLALQLRMKHDRGNAFDAFHLAYAPHVDAVFTHDAVLARLNAEFPDHPYLCRVRPYAEFDESFMGGA